MRVSEEEPGVPRISRVTVEQVRDHMVATALAVAAGAPASTGSPARGR